MTLKLYKPDGQGGLEPQPGADPDWQAQLRSPRWGRGLGRGRLPDLKNTEMNPTDKVRSVMVWIGLAVGTFVVIVLGYGTGFWG